MKGLKAMSEPVMGTAVTAGSSVTTAPPVPSVVIEAQVQQDYFGFSSTTRFTFPDGLTFVELKSMNEGEKAEYQRRTQRDLVVERQSGNARVKVDPASERHALLETCIVDWNLLKQGAPFPYSVRNLREWLRVANPRIVEDIEKDIRKANPWLLADMTVEDIDKEIENLQEMRKVAEERERGE
jgi:hypothetical protein